MAHHIIFSTVIHSTETVARSQSLSRFYLDLQSVLRAKVICLELRDYCGNGGDTFNSNHVKTEQPTIILQE